MRACTLSVVRAGTVSAEGGNDPGGSAVQEHAQLFRVEPG